MNNWDWRGGSEVKGRVCLVNVRSATLLQEVQNYLILWSSGTFSDEQPRQYDIAQNRKGLAQKITKRGTQVLFGDSGRDKVKEETVAARGTE